MLRFLRRLWARYRPPREPRMATRIRIDMRIYREAEDRWYDLPSVETVI